MATRNHQISILISATDQASGPLNKVGGALGGIAQVAGGVLLANGITAVGRALGGLASQGVGAIGMAADLEAQLSGVQAAMGASASEIEQLKGLVSDLGVDRNLKVTSLEAAAAIEELGLQGLSVEQILGGAARATVLLSNATGGDFVQSATVATDAMSLWNIAAKDMEQAVDGITAVASVSKFGIEDYALALAQGGGVAASVGVEFEDFNTTIAALAPLFSSGSDAGTSFKTFLQRLIPTTKPATKAMRELGLITADGANQFFDANGQMKDMAEITGILNEATRDLTEEQKNQYFSTIFGTDAMRAAFGIAGLTEEQFRELAATMGDVSAADAAATRMDNLRGSMEILGGIVETVKIRIGDEFLPVLQRGVEGVASIVQDKADSIVGFFEKLASTIDLIGRAEDPLGKASIAISGIMQAFGANPGQVAAVVGSFRELVTSIQEGDLEGALNGLEGLLSTFLPESVVERIGRFNDGLLDLAGRIGEAKTKLDEGDLAGALAVFIPEGWAVKVADAATAVGEFATKLGEFVDISREEGLQEGLAHLVGEEWADRVFDAGRAVGDFAGGIASFVAHNPAQVIQEIKGIGAALLVVAAAQGAVTVVQGFSNAVGLLKIALAGVHWPLFLLVTLLSLEAAQVAAPDSFLARVAGWTDKIGAFAMSTWPQLLLLAGGITAAGGAASLAGIGFSGLLLALLPIAGPIALIGLAIAALALIWNSNLGGIQEKTAAFWFEHIEPITSALRNTFEVTIPQALFILQIRWNFFWMNIQEETQQIWNSLKEIWGEIDTYFTETIPGNLADMKTAWDRDMNRIKEISDSVWNTIKGWIDGVTGTIDRLWGRIEEFVGWLGGLSIPNPFASIQAPDLSIPGVGGAPDKAGVDKRAAGGPVMAGLPYWVGERGPELIVPRRSGYVIPAGESQRMTQGGSGRSVVIHQHIYNDVDYELAARRTAELIMAEAA